MPKKAKFYQIAERISRIEGTKDMQTGEIVGLITARGGSRRIPGKNVVTLCGKPLIAHTIEAALAARSLTRTIVSTDSVKIAAVSRRFGAEVPFMRPETLATATAKSIDVVRHTARRLERNGVSLKAIVLLQPTSPLRTARDIERAVKLFLEKRCDSVISVTAIPNRPAQQGNDFRTAVKKKLLRLILLDGRLVTPGNLASAVKARSCRLNGAIYVLGRRVMLGRTPIENDRAQAYVMPATRSIDIDEPEDLREVEKFAARQSRNQK